MCTTLQVRWTIIATIAPRPWIVCSGCGGLRAFHCSNKIRLNANGRKLDAWLIYKCAACDKTWNRPLLERQNVRAIDPLLLVALQANDPDWVQAAAFDLDALRRLSQRVDEFPEVEVRKQLLRDPVDWDRLSIDLAVPFPAGVRLDRLLASELEVSRSKVHALHQSGLLRTDPDRSDVLRRRIRNGSRVTLDLSTVSDRNLVWKPKAAGKASGC